MKKTIVVSALLLCVALGGQIALRASREAAAPALAEGAYAVLGGLRSLIAEVIWFRADRLQEEGRYVELAQLASTLAAMEPHTPEIWSYASWNLAYNISVMMPNAEDRWRWVEAGISLLRDEGLVLNPGDPDLCRDLAWLFEIKLGADIESSAPVYRKLWREKVADVKARGAWDELRMEPLKMLEVERVTGFDDWGDARLSAIYWAKEGLPKAKGQVLAHLDSIIRQSSIIYRKSH